MTVDHMKGEHKVHTTFQMVSGNFPLMLISQTEKTIDCNAASKLMVSKWNIQRWRQQKEKLIQTPPQNVSMDPHMVITKTQNKKFVCALKR
jgi:hypothetical protein